MKFKKGDRVRCVLKKRGSGWNNSGKMDYLLKGVHTIDEISFCGDIKFKRKGGFRYWYCKDCQFELASRYDNVIII